MSYNLESKVQKSFANVEKNFIVDNNCNVVCPWIIRNGATNLTEQGAVDNTQNPDAYGFFQKVFTGNECITATWENSTKLVKPTGVNAYDYQFQVGDYYQGAIVVGSGEYGVEIESLESMEDFLSMKSNAQVTMRFESWAPSNKDLYKLYTIPDLYGKKWYYISNVKILNDLQFSGEDNITSIPAVEVTFTSLVDKLQNTGKAVEQFVQYGAIGEPYTYPYVSKTQQENEQGYIETTTEVKNIVQPPKHSKYLQLELFGANALSGVQVVGRKITKNEDGTFRTSPWKFFVPIALFNGRANDINKTSLATKNFFYFPQETLAYRFSQNLWTSIKNVNDAIATNHNAGEFSMDKAGNWSDIATGKHKSNPIDETEGGTGLRKDYNDLSWHPILADYTIDTKGCYYTADTLSYTTSDTVLSILTKNGFAYSTQEVLPLGFYSSKPYKISNLLILGGLISKWAGDWTISSRTKNIKPINIGYFMDCDIAGMLVNIFDQTQQAGQDNTLWGPTLALAGGEKAPKWLGTTACNTTLLMELTDRIVNNGTNYDTILLGQNTNEDGSYIFESHETFLYSGQEPAYHIPTSSDEFWFVIDEVTVQAMFNGTMKITAFDNINNTNSSIFSTAVKSTAGWTESIRDWTTSIKTGCWENNWCEQEDEFTWPKDPTKPIYPSVLTPTLYVDNSDTYLWTREENADYQKIWPANQVGFNTFNALTNTISAISRDGYAPKTLEVAYADLGISGVTNLETLKQNIGQFRINFSGSYMYGYYFTFSYPLFSGPYEDQVEISSIYQDIDISNLQSGSNTFNFNVVGMGNTYNNMLVSKNNNDITNNIMTYAVNPTFWSYNSQIGGFEGNITLEVVCGESTITFKLYDKSQFIVNNATTNDTIYYQRQKTSGHIRHRQQLQYLVKIPNIQFIKKQ